MEDLKMTDLEKQQIHENVSAYCKHIGSGNKAANTLSGVSGATMNHILNHKWELIADEMWRKVAAQIDFDASANTWVVVSTCGFERMTTLLRDAKLYSNVFAIIGDAGSGKSEAIKCFKKANKRVFVLSCSEYWNRKQFMTELLQTMGRDFSGFTVGEMMNDILIELQKTDKPLIVLDEADKLTDHVLYFFITLYNKLEDQCGIVLCATDYLEKRIKRGVRLNKKGYKEIFSRIGRKFIPIQVVNDDDVSAVCHANGISAPKVIKEICKDCESDLRRVKRKIHAVKQALKSN